MLSEFKRWFSHLTICICLTDKIFDSIKHLVDKTSIKFFKVSLSVSCHYKYKRSILDNLLTVCPSIASFFLEVHKMVKDETSHYGLCIKIELISDSIYFISIFNASQVSRSVFQITL